MIGRPYSPTDVDNEFGIIKWLGYPVRTEDQAPSECLGTLANVDTQGVATIERDGFVHALVPAESVRLALSADWSA